MKAATIAVAKSFDGFATAAWGTPERRFNGSALSVVREVPQTAGHPNKTLFLATAICASASAVDNTFFSEFVCE